MREKKWPAVGDIVQLRSGGPLMTVSAEVRSEVEFEKVYYFCVWFSNDSSSLRGERFLAEILTVVEKERKP